MRRRILTPADLPAPGVPETLVLDFKKDVPPHPTFEHAKDVAALANAVGGTLIVGARSRKEGQPRDGRAEQLIHYEPLELDFVQKLLNAFDKAIEDRCQPAPLFACQSIEVGDGFVLAINVEPAFSQPIGVRVNKADDYERPAWCFPIRVGTQTRYLSAENLPMYMEPRIRRIVIALHNIPELEPVILRRAHGDQTVDRRTALARVSEVENVACFADDVVSLDDIQTVYKLGNHWVVRHAPSTGR